MPTVYITSSNPYTRKFHRTEDCVQLRKGPARGEAREIISIDLAEISSERPCKQCYPDAPVAKSHHRYCYVCDPGSIRPCEHNGGVRVYMTRTHQKDHLLHEAGQQYIQERWVWPERARLYLTA